MKIKIAHIKDEYKIKIGNRYNYIDLLLFNYEYNCFTVIELKVTELKKEHISQIQVYMNYIDNNLRKMYQDKTIVLLFVKMIINMLLNTVLITELFQEYMNLCEIEFY